MEEEEEIKAKASKEKKAGKQPKFEPVVRFYFILRTHIYGSDNFQRRSSSINPFAILENRKTTALRLKIQE